MSYLKKLIRGADDREDSTVAEDNHTLKSGVFHDRNGDPVNTSPTTEERVPVHVKAHRQNTRNYDALARRHTEILQAIAEFQTELAQVELTMRAVDASLRVLNDARIDEAAVEAMAATLEVKPETIVHKHENINTAV